MGVLVGLLMQYPCGRIKPPRIGQQRFALLPGYERGGGGALGGRSRNETGSRRADIVAPRSFVIEEWPSCCSIHNVVGFLDAVEEEVDGETAPFLSAFTITWCYRSGFQSSSSERQRERNSRSPLAAPLYFSPRQVSKPAKRLLFFLWLCLVLPRACFIISQPALSSHDDMAYNF